MITVGDPKILFGNFFSTQKALRSKGGRIEQTHHLKLSSHKHLRQKHTFPAPRQSSAPLSCPDFNQQHYLFGFFMYSQGERPSLSTWLRVPIVGPSHPIPLFSLLPSSWFLKAQPQITIAQCTVLPCALKTKTKLNLNICGVFGFCSKSGQPLAK